MAQTVEQFLLDDKTRELLVSLANQLHVSPSKVVDRAVDAYASQVAAVPSDWKERIRKAAGIWKDRTDLPDFDVLRRSFDRDAWKDRGDA